MLKVKEREELEKVLNSEEYKTLYQGELLKLTAELEKICKEAGEKTEHIAVNTILSRLKTSDSIIDKLERKKKEISVDSMLNNMNDLAGLRVICSFLDDVYCISDAISKMKEYEIVKKKDFIKNPKSSGYQSLHIILKRKGSEFLGHPVKIEIQIRTAAMNFWSVLEYQLQYKKRKKSVKAVKEQLRSFAVSIAAIDREMVEIRDRIQKIKA